MTSDDFFRDNWIDHLITFQITDYETFVSY